MPMQARRVELVVLRDLYRRLAGSEAAVNFAALEVLASFTRSAHADKIAAARLSRVYRSLITSKRRMSRPKLDRYRKIPLFSFGLCTHIGWSRQPITPL